MLCDVDLYAFLGWFQDSVKLKLQKKTFSLEEMVEVFKFAQGNQNCGSRALQISLIMGG